MNKDLGELSRKLLKEKYNESLYCPAPEPHISGDKPVILYIGMNPAGGKDDADRDKKTNGLFLNYYEEFEGENGLSEMLINSKENSKGFAYKKYFYPILDFFTKASGRKIAWEWCNYPLDELYKRIECSGFKLSESDKKCLKHCHKKYIQEAKYQLIIRDLVYYHQTKDFNALLKSVSDSEAQKTVKDLIDSYIDTIPNANQLKLIYVSSATSCNYVMTLPNKKIEDFGGFYYFYNDCVKIPIILAGRQLNGLGRIDNYSKIRLFSSVKSLLDSENCN